MALGSSIIELALGMILFYFLLSVLCAHINELIAGVLDWRAQELVKGIQDLLNEPPAHGAADLPPDASRRQRLGNWTQQRWQQLRPRSAVARRSDALEDLTDLGDQLLKHAQIRSLTTEPLLLRRLILFVRFLIRNKQQQPAYIPPSIFSTALIDTLVKTGLNNKLTSAGIADPKQRQTEVVRQRAILTPEQMVIVIRQTVTKLPPELRDSLLPLVDKTAPDLDAVRLNIETWFNAKMDRVKGSYKRWTQLILFMIGLAASALLNADSFAVATTLWQNPTLRQAIADQAQQVANAPTATPAPQSSDAPTATPNLNARTSEQIEQVQRDIQNTLVFPITWGSRCAYNASTNTTSRASDVSENGRTAPFDPANCMPQNRDWWGWLIKLCGLLATTLAISLGASFWFDLLRRVSNLRSNGPSPDDSDSATTSMR